MLLLLLAWRLNKWTLSFGCGSIGGEDRSQQAQQPVSLTDISERGDPEGEWPDQSFNSLSILLK